MILVTYDVCVTDPEGKKRLRNVAKACVDNGIRVQNSVFECELNPAQLVRLKAKLLSTYDQRRDSLRFYYLGSNWQNKVEHFGVKPGLDPFGDALIV